MAFHFVYKNDADAELDALFHDSQSETERKLLGRIAFIYRSIQAFESGIKFPLFLLTFTSPSVPFVKLAEHQENRNKNRAAI